MLRKIILIITLLCFPILAAAQQVPRVFSADDVRATLASSTFGGIVSVGPAFAGSDLSAFEYKGPTAGLYPILDFTAPSSGTTSRALSGYICVNPAFSEPRLLLTYADDHETIAQVTVGGLESFVPFRLELPGKPRINRFELQIKESESDNPLSAVFCDVQLSTTSAAESVVNYTPSPANGFNPDSFPQIVRRFAGNDFDAHANMLAMNPVTMVGSVVNGNETREIDVLAPSNLPLRSIPILAVDDPGITNGDYAITGDISYGSGHAPENNLSNGDISGVGYLEMWSDFADGSSYFTRTLASSGPMRMLRGRSGPRSFLLPFHSGDRRPTRIRMDLVMPGTGTFALSNLRLMQTAAPVVATAAPFWFNPRYFWIGEAVLPLFVMVIALEPLIRRGRARRIVMSWIWICFAFAQLCIAWSMAAVGRGIPLKEVGPMLLINLMVMLCALFGSRRMPRRYQNAELKRMQLMDAV